MNRRYRLIFAAGLLAALTGCTQRQPENSGDLKERTAEATAAAKRDAKAIAQGIREGWSRDKPLDLNSASKDQLQDLPDISSAEADRILAARPYDEPRDLVKRRVLTQSQYDKISDRVVAKK
jgi:DNA uptake protein ComE-like DNA-binding protein